MSKEIYLYSEDKKYKCAVELADSCDSFGCHDHSMIILTEERPDGTYVIAQAKDRILETEKDKQIAELQKQLKQSQKQLAIEELKDLRDKICDIGYDEDYNTDYFEVMKEIDNQIKQLKEWR